MVYYCIWLGVCDECAGEDAHCYMQSAIAILLLLLFWKGLDEC
jgi:hypothetical protein